MLGWVLVGVVLVVIIVVIKRNAKDQQAASPLEDAGLLAGTVYQLVRVRTETSGHPAIADETVLDLAHADGRKFTLLLDPSRVSLHFDIRKPPQFVRPKVYVSGLITLTKATSFTEEDADAPPEAIYPVGLEEKPAVAA